MEKPGKAEVKWYIVDAAGQTLGRLASQVAAVIRGKHKPTYKIPLRHLHEDLSFPRYSSH